MGADQSSSRAPARPTVAVRETLRQASWGGKSGRGQLWKNSVAERTPSGKVVRSDRRRAQLNQMKQRRNQMQWILNELRREMGLEKQAMKDIAEVLKRGGNAGGAPNPTLDGLFQAALDNTERELALLQELNLQKLKLRHDLIEGTVTDGARLEDAAAATTDSSEGRGERGAHITLGTASPDDTDMGGDNLGAMWRNSVAKRAKAGGALDRPEAQLTQMLQRAMQMRWIMGHLEQEFERESRRTVRIEGLLDMGDSGNGKKLDALFENALLGCEFQLALLQELNFERLKLRHDLIMKKVTVAGHVAGQVRARPPTSSAKKVGRSTSRPTTRGTTQLRRTNRTPSI
jgi:hypothetical protein